MAIRWKRPVTKHRVRGVASVLAPVVFYSPVRYAADKMSGGPGVSAEQ